ncbi:unnamed protein product [Rotaria sp. Silwood1]|nr:unnamed protein product [Rotaria sp. Silwood1]CAF1607915.1 unnamed protein product [Rotaria sp. Silwood1]
MHYQLTQLLIIGFYIIHLTESSFIYNIANASKLLCYSCKGSNCEKISNDDDNLIICNKNTQLCWAGFINHIPYRTCASRYCTPIDISLDSDVHIETCCHSNLCNSISLPWLTGSEQQAKNLAHHHKTSTVSSTISTTERKTTIIKKISTTPEIYVVNEILKNGKKSPSSTDSSEDDSIDVSKSKSKPYGSQTGNYGANWERISYDSAFSIRVESISKLLILIMPVLLVLIF